MIISRRILGNAKISKREKKREAEEMEAGKRRNKKSFYKSSRRRQWSTKAERGKGEEQHRGRRVNTNINVEMVGNKKKNLK